MPELLTIDPAKLAALTAIQRPHVAELVAVYWPAPDGVRYYATSQLDELPNYAALSLGPIEARLALRSASDPERFLSVTLDSGIGDEMVPFDLNDSDGEISRLSYVHGEGIKTEILYYFPQVDLTVPLWWGHLRLPDDADSARFKVKAQSGFRSPQLSIPRRAFFSDNHAAICGRRLNSLEEIADNDCPYNRHVGGNIGLLDGNGEPKPPCPQNTRADCIATLGDDLSYLGFDTIIESLINNQTKGPALLATSRGNESNLKRPLRVIIGKRIVRDCDLLAFTPQTNTRHPDQGFVRVLFAVSEGRNKSTTGCKVNGSIIGFEHLNVRLGARRQSRTGFSPQIGNYSGTDHFFGVYGPVNPAQYNAGNLKGEATVEGLDEIRAYTDENTYNKLYTTNRAWGLMEMYRNRR